MHIPYYPSTIYYYPSIIHYYLIVSFHISYGIHFYHVTFLLFLTYIIDCSAIHPISLSICVILGPPKGPQSKIAAGCHYSFPPLARKWDDPLSLLYLITHTKHIETSAQDGGTMIATIYEEIERPDHGSSKAAKLRQQDERRR